MFQKLFPTFVFLPLFKKSSSKTFLVSNRTVKNFFHSVPPKIRNKLSCIFYKQRFKWKTGWLLPSFSLLWLSRYLFFVNNFAQLLLSLGISKCCFWCRNEINLCRESSQSTAYIILKCRYLFLNSALKKFQNWFHYSH